jgi:hypothetical protein
MGNGHDSSGCRIGLTLEHPFCYGAWDDQA